MALSRRWTQRPIRLSRHARNAVRLYEILDEEIEATIDDPDDEAEERGRRVGLKRFGDRFSRSPLKVVYVVEREVVVVTAYPVLRSYRRRSTR